MHKCIYCEKNDLEASFTSREHVIPRLMGSFDNNPTIINWVCDDCNQKVFNPLETKFKEDTEEGIFYQMFNLNGTYEIRIKNKSIKTSFSSGLRDNFFDELFPLLRVNAGKIEALLLSQIKVKRRNDSGYSIFLIDKLKEIEKNEVKFSKVKKLFKGVKSKDICIFTGSHSEFDDSSLDEAISIIKRLGINYEEKNRRSSAINKEKQFKVSMECTINNDVGRIISKIAFNYFSYCALKEGKKEILFNDNFSKIKSYIIGKYNPPVKEIIKAVESEPIIYDEKIGNLRLIGHTITFNEENGHIISRVSFLGRRIYTINLGLILEELKSESFGCGHLFDPFSKRILGLSQNFRKWGSGQKIEFGLFNRV